MKRNWELSPTYLSTKASICILCQFETAGPVVTAPRTSPRRLAVRSPSMLQLFRDHTGKCVDIGLRPSSPYLNRATKNANTKSGTPVTAKSLTVTCPMIRPQRYSTLEIPTSGNQPHDGSDGIALINRTVRILANNPVQQFVISLLTT